MRGSGLEYESCRSNISKLVSWYTNHPGDRNEATTRLQLVDKLFFDCLGWSPDDKIVLEKEHDGEYADYVFSCDNLSGIMSDVLIVEAKREGDAFEIPAGKVRLTYSLKSLQADSPNLKKTLKQVASYCQERGVPIAAACNGHQVVAFVASRNDGKPPLDGQALVFPSLQFMESHFLDLWQSLSRSGIQESRLLHKLVGGVSQELPPKLSASIMTYPGIKARNIFQADMKILTELVIEDVSRSVEIEDDFLKECYCQSNALSQYSQLSRDILSARYAVLFDEKSQGPPTIPASTTKGITPELFADSMSRRPILLIGDVGVGKTMFQRHLIRIDAVGLMRNAISLYINLGTQATLSSDLKKFLIGEIERQLREDYDIDVFLSSEFVRGVYNLELKRFDKSIYGALKETNPSLYELKKLEFLDSKLSDRPEHIRQALEHIVKGQRKQVVIFLDNADQRGHEVQEEVFLISQEIASHWPATVFVPIRPETFHRSKKKDALSGYHAKAFTISPPHIDDVIKKRLTFALKIAGGEVPLTFAKFRPATMKFEAVRSIIRTFLFSFDHNRELAELLDNVSHGSVRLALDLVQQYFGSGHVDTQKIHNAVINNKFYLIPLHEFLRALMFGDAVFYHPERSPIANLFDVSQADPKEHFLVPMMIGIVSFIKNLGKSEGFVEYSGPQKVDHSGHLDLLKHFPSQSL